MSEDRERAVKIAALDAWLKNILLVHAQFDSLTTKVGDEMREDLDTHLAKRGFALPNRVTGEIENLEMQTAQLNGRLIFGDIFKEALEGLNKENPKPMLDLFHKAEATVKEFGKNIQDDHDDESDEPFNPDYVFDWISEDNIATWRGMLNDLGVFTAPAN